MERLHRITGQILLISVMIAGITGCSDKFKDTVSCDYQPVRGSVVRVDDSEPVTVRFTPDSPGDNIWFERFKVDKNHLEAPLQQQHEPMRPSERHDAIINVRTSGRCAPYIVYIQH